MRNVPEIRIAGYDDAWEQRKLSDIAERFDNMRIPVAANLRISGDTPYYGANGIQDYVEGYTHDGEFVLVAEDGANDLKNYPVKYVIGRIWVNNHAHVLQGKTNTTNNRFLSYALGSVAIESILVGGGRAKLNADAMMNISLLLPQYAEQEKIGNCFASLDSLLTLHQRKYDKLKATKAALLQKMFPKEGESVPELRFPGFTDAWEQRKFGDLITEYKETVDSKCTLPILTSSKTEGIVSQEEHFSNKQNHDINGYNILPRGYCTYRNRSDGVDFTFNINNYCDKGIVSKFYPVFYGKTNDTTFLSLVLNNSEEVVHEIAYTATGTGQKVLAFSDLQKMLIRVPSWEEQKRIASQFDALDNLLTLHQRECEKLQEVKKALLEKMFPGGDN